MTFSPLGLRFDESNSSFALAVLPWVRIALTLCNGDRRKIENFVMDMTGGEDKLTPLLERMRKVRRNLGALCEWLDEAEARIETVQGGPPAAPSARA
jgi:hypothetical protein